MRKKSGGGRDPPDGENRVEEIDKKTMEMKVVVVVVMVKEKRMEETREERRETGRAAAVRVVCSGDPTVYCLLRPQRTGQDRTGQDRMEQFLLVRRLTHAIAGPLSIHCSFALSSSISLTLPANVPDKR